MKKELQKIERKFHKAVMGIKCCNGKLKYEKDIDEKSHQMTETYWCPKCGSTLTRTQFFLDQEE